MANVYSDELPVNPDELVGDDVGVRCEEPLGDGMTGCAVTDFIPVGESMVLMPVDRHEGPSRRKNSRCACG